MSRGTTNGPRFGVGNPTPLPTPPPSALQGPRASEVLLIGSTSTREIGSISSNSINSSSSSSCCEHRITSSVKYKCRRRIFGGAILQVVPSCRAGTNITLTVIVQCLVLILALRINVVLADCWYDNESHLEGVEVSTAEPCLNCTCTRGALLCYLRICPQLPNPPPSGCILLHRHRTCCSELICADPPMGNRLEARSDSDYSMDFPKRRIPALKHACISKGTIYAPGSAMDTSSQCEYCYCLGGEQQCVKPKCLAPLDGCIPRYDPNDCCPVHYNCTGGFYTTSSSSTTTTVLPIEYDSRGGCIVESKFYPEGHKVLGFGHSICDNCYCIRGMIRCEPLSCAPALFGCLPVIKTGECCPASYNCSGTIETHPLPHYGQFPVVSKEYAKLRKETQYKRTTSKFVPHYKRNSSTENTNRPYYVIAESQSQKSTKSHKDSSYTESSRIINIETYTKDPYYVTVNNRENETKAKSTNGGPGIVEITYRPKYNNSKHVYQFSASDNERNKTGSTLLATTESTLSDQQKIDPILSVDLFIDGRINRGIENENMTTTHESTTNFDNSTETGKTTTMDEITDSTTNPQMTTTEEEISSTETSTSETTLTSTAVAIETETTTLDTNLPITLKTILNSTECEENNSTSIGTTSTEESIKLLKTSIAEESKGKVDKIELRNIAQFNDTQSDANVDSIHMVLLNNLTKAKEDYDYDYAEPTLPPSLPNLRIIPFVAADALESKKDIKKSDIYAEKLSNNHQAEEFPFSGIFSPPVETQGGFIPKEPLIITHHEYYTTTNEDHAGVPITINPVPAITNAPITKENNCIVDGRTLTHEESITTEGSCSTCVCYFGSVVCHEPECPVRTPGCKTEEDTSSDRICCPKIICDDDVKESSEHVKITTSNSTLAVATVADGIIVTPIPLYNVIRTEITPSLHLLITDMRPYFSHTYPERATTIPVLSTSSNMKEISTTVVPNKIAKSTQKLEEFETSTTESPDDGFSLDKVWKLLFSSHLDETTTQKTIPVESTTIKVTTTRKTTTARVSIMESDLLLPLEQLNFQRYNIYDNMVRRQDFIVPRPTEDTTKSINSINNNIGLLKLAGCNIYGRMYRVGRIISELSGPCLECKCTESGVQCHSLLC